MAEAWTMKTKLKFLWIEHMLALVYPSIFAMWYIDCDPTMLSSNVASCEQLGQVTFIFLTVPQVPGIIFFLQIPGPCCPTLLVGMLSAEEFHGLGLLMTNDISESFGLTSNHPQGHILLPSQMSDCERCVRTGVRKGCSVETSVRCSVGTYRIMGCNVRITVGNRFNIMTSMKRQCSFGTCVRWRRLSVQFWDNCEKVVQWENKWEEGVKCQNRCKKWV